jgi:hypothetical protein
MRYGMILLLALTATPALAQLSSGPRWPNQPPMLSDGSTASRRIEPTEQVLRQYKQDRQDLVDDISQRLHQDVYRQRCGASSLRVC